jgi:hypothetical protein
MISFTYLRVLWLHLHPNEPIDLWSELDGDRYETRKLEFFPDGRIGYADKSDAAHGTQLGIEVMPTFEEIASQAEFKPEILTRDAFESMWAIRKDRLV